MKDRIRHYFGYDGEIELPEEGIADFLGQPHYFWLVQGLMDERAGEFEIAPVGPELLDHVNEIGAIWHAWDVAYHAGTVELSSHPMQPGSNPRYVELIARVEQSALVLRQDAIPIVGAVSTSPEYLAHVQQFVGQKWPAPGTCSPVLEIEWRAAREA